jgi:hypothetical protein
MFLTIVVTGVFTWLIGKMFAAKEGFSGAMVIASYAFMPRILGAVASGIIALLSDPVNMTSMNAIATGPLRFINPDTSGALMNTLMTRLDVSIDWETILLGVGIHIIGRVSRGKAVAFAITIWVIGALPTLRQFYLAS